MHKYIFSLIKNPNKKFFEVKAKIKVSVPSDIINRSKSIDYRLQINSDLWSIQKLEQYLMVLQKISLLILGFLG